MGNIKRRVIGIGLSIAIAAGGAGCVFGWARYANKEYGFSIIFPRYWETEGRGVGAAAVLSMAPLESTTDRFQENAAVVVSDLVEVLPLETVFQANKEQIMAAFPGKETDIVEGKINAGRLTGRWMAFTTNMSSGFPIRTISAVWMKGKRVYAVSCSAAADEYDSYESIFQKILHSFRIID